ncbi:MAG TPA: polyprenyl synthetase family protein [Actinomycetota bacterium]|nr:polyprenyl synthetase family protein [Actinomycetota bacterium]
MMAYHLGWLNQELRPCAADGGKRIRPALCFLACEHVGAAAAVALPGAMAVELIHNFSLVHDDIEDNSPLRRHRATVWSLWGVGHGINVGDGLFALAQLALLESGDGLDGVDPKKPNRAARTLNRTCLALCEGQALDLELQSGEAADLASYLTMIRGKTAALFGCAAELGALLAGAPDSVTHRMGEFGRAMGEAYQMLDDVMGVWGTPSATGKLASDVLQRKHGLPAVLAWRRAEAADLGRLRVLYRKPEPMADEEARWVVRLFDRLGVREEAERLMLDRLGRAEAVLRSLDPPRGAPSPLHELVATVAGWSGNGDAMPG